MSDANYQYGDDYRAAGVKDAGAEETNMANSKEDYQRKPMK